MSYFAGTKVGLSGVLLLLVALQLSACVGGRPVRKPPDERFGHRFEGEAPDGRPVISITEPDTSVSYFYYPALFDSVYIRPAPFKEDIPTEAQQTPVEVLIKGAFPDACTELGLLEQTRAGHIVSLSLQMRRPQGAVCATVVRPYRFYVLLEGLYEAGDYTLKLNNRYFPFQVMAPDGPS